MTTTTADDNYATGHQLGTHASKCNSYSYCISSNSSNSSYDPDLLEDFENSSDDSDCVHSG